MRSRRTLFPTLRQPLRRCSVTLWPALLRSSSVPGTNSLRAVDSSMLGTMPRMSVLPPSRALTMLFLSAQRLRLVSRLLRLSRRLLGSVNVACCSQRLCCLSILCVRPGCDVQLLCTWSEHLGVGLGLLAARCRSGDYYPEGTGGGWERRDPDSRIGATTRY